MRRAQLNGTGCFLLFRPVAGVVRDGSELSRFLYYSLEFLLPGWSFEFLARRMALIMNELMQPGDSGNEGASSRSVLAVSYHGGG